jgi:hypothetical protein
MKYDLPSAIIILTDGYVEFLKKKDSINIPVLWVLNTNEKPPFGKIIRI